MARYSLGALSFGSLVLDGALGPQDCGCHQREGLCLRRGLHGAYSRSAGLSALGDCKRTRAGVGTLDGRFARIDSQIRANRLIPANRLRVPELNPCFCESRFGPLKYMRIAGLKRIARTL